MNIAGRSCFFLGVILLSAAIGLAVTGVRMSGEASAVNAISMGDNFFEPLGMTVPAGTTVQWRNDGVLPHTVTSDTGAALAFDSGIIRTGGTYSLTFDAPGSFAYHCDVHPEMTGAVMVEEAAAAPSPTATATTPAPQPTASQPGQALSGGAAPADALPVGGGAPPIARDMMSSALLLSIVGCVLVVTGLFTMRMATAGVSRARD